MREIKKNKKNKTSVEKTAKTNKKSKKKIKDDVETKKNVKEDIIVEENTKKSKCNIFIVIISLLLFISSLTLGYTCLKYSELRKKNTNLENDINVVKDKIVNIDNDYITYSDELENMKNELKDKIEEYNIWLETIEKVK